MAPVEGQGYTRVAMKTPRPSIKTRKQEARAASQREANRRALEQGLPLPYPNLWDILDPTKIDPKEAVPEAFEKSCREFRKLCRPRQRKKHFL